MFKFLVRCLMVLGGIALLADLFLPLRSAALTVDRHTSRLKVESSIKRGGWADTSYTVHFAGGLPASCSVGYSVYTALEDGDAVNVASTRLFKDCVRITKGEQPILWDPRWRWWKLVFALALMALGLGWIESDDRGARIL